MRFLVPLHKFSSICRKTQISTFISLLICLSFCFSATVGSKPAHKNATIFATFPPKPPKTRAKTKRDRQKPTSLQLSLLKIILHSNYSCLKSFKSSTLKFLM